MELHALVLSVDILNIRVASIGLRLIELWLQGVSVLSNINRSRNTHGDWCLHLAGFE